MASCLSFDDFILTIGIQGPKFDRHYLMKYQTGLRTRIHSNLTILPHGTSFLEEQGVIICFVECI